MNLPKLESLDLFEKKVFVRLDLDVPLTKKENSDSKFGYEVKDSTRLEVSRNTIRTLLDSGVKQIYLGGHVGRPSKEGEYISTFNLLKVLSDIYGRPVTFQPVVSLSASQKNLDPSDGSTHNLVLLENLRAISGETKNDQEFARSLADLADFYVNESFAESHREVASIVGVPKLLPHAAGLHFVEEVENLTKVVEGAEKPVVVIIGGVKEDKLPYIKPFSEFSDKVLVAGRLPDYIEKNSILDSELSRNDKIVVANLNADKEDITVHSIELFEKEIAKAKTIVLAGPMGKYEEEGHRLGTKRVFEAIKNSRAFKVAGGGDTENALSTLGFETIFNWVSIGGGAMLEFLTKRTLPGIEALLN
jgi:phosphoglycerate kinase